MFVVRKNLQRPLGGSWRVFRPKCESASRIAREICGFVKIRCYVKIKNVGKINLVLENRGECLEHFRVCSCSILWF